MMGFKSGLSTIEYIPVMIINNVIVILSKHVFEKIINCASQKLFNFDVYVYEKYIPEINVENCSKGNNKKGRSGNWLTSWYFRLFKRYYLEAHSIDNNKLLLEFDVKSRYIQWDEFTVPLRKRGPAVYLGSDFNYMGNGRKHVDDVNRREVLVCHDMMGNYREDRHYNSSKKWDDYRYYHWSGVDYFCYFSHHYITIPPCNWINAAHQHGVRVIGTLITEHEEGRQRMIEILRTDESIRRTVNALVRLCQHFCFEGWLINVECNIPRDLVKNLVKFVENLRSSVAQYVSDGVVFWYDSVIDTGSVAWQNEVNDKNIRFFHASDGMLVNYNWNELSLMKTGLKVSQENAKSWKTFFGIDVFGRGQVAKFQSSETLAKIVENDFSTGFFAPGWTFESLSENGYQLNDKNGDHQLNKAFLARNEKFWWLLWDYIATYSYQHLPFFTDFCLGSGEFNFRHGEKTDGEFFCLSKQSIQPSVPLFDFAERDYKLAFNGGSSLKIVKSDVSFRIFALDFEVKHHLVVAYVFKLNDADGDFDCILRFYQGNENNDCYLFMGNYNNGYQLFKGRCYTSAMNQIHYPAISQWFIDNHSHIKIPFALGNDWQVRYYITTFDSPVKVQDMGVLYRKCPQSSNKEAHLGAVYVNVFSGNLPSQFSGSNHVFLNLKEDAILN